MKMSGENMENLTQKSEFESETQSEKENSGMSNKRVKIGVILILGFVLLNFVLVVLVMNRTSEISSSFSTKDFSAVVNQTRETGKMIDDMKFELGGIEKWRNSTEEKLESHQIQMQALSNQTKIDKKIETLAKDNRELKKSHDELKEQFESLIQKLDKLENPRSIKSCSDAMEILRPPASKVEVIDPHGNSKNLEVLCDFETDGGGWTIIQKRSRGPKEEFKQNWNEYQNGFGSLDENFWIGLENIHALTQNGDQELRIEMEDFEGNKTYAKYSSFSISDASDFYRLTIGGFSEHSTAGDSMTDINGQKFSTMDKDNDNWSRGDCAVEEGGGGGWWFGNCAQSNLNGLYFEKGETVPHKQGIYWWKWKGFSYSMAKSEMKIRKRKP